VIRRPTSDEAFETLLFHLRNMPFYRRSRYTVALPAHQRFQKLTAPVARLETVDLAALRRLFTTEVYRPTEYDAALRSLEQGRAAARVREAFPMFARLSRGWGFRMPPRYDVILTLCGPGGSFRYDDRVGTILLLATADGRFNKNGRLDDRPETAVETILHEMAHIGIEDAVVRRFSLDHWEKERVVDRLCQVAFRRQLPRYRVQGPPAHALDAFVTEATLDDLPTAIAGYAARRPAP
jgi:hypothetical protein